MRSGGVNAGEEGDGEQGLTERFKALGGAFCDGGVEAELREEEIEEWRASRGRTAGKELGSSNGDGGVGTGGVKARKQERERERDRAHGREERMASVLEPVGARMPSTRHRGPDAVQRARPAVALSERRGKVRARGRPGWLRWLGRLVCASQPVNSVDIW